MAKVPLPAIRTKRAFKTRWHELHYIEDKIEYWKSHDDHRRAARFEARSAELMKGARLVENMFSITAMARVARHIGDWKLLERSLAMELALIESLQASEDDELTRSSHPPAIMVHVHNEMAMARARLGRHSDARASLARAARICQRHGIRNQTAYRRTIFALLRTPRR